MEWNGTPVGRLSLERAPNHLRLRKLFIAASLPLRLSMLRAATRAMNFHLRKGLVPLKPPRSASSCNRRPEISTDPVL